MSPQKAVRHDASVGFDEHKTCGKLDHNPIWGDYPMPGYRSLCLAGVVVFLGCSASSAMAQLDKNHDYLPFKLIDGMTRGNHTETRFDAHNFRSDPSGATTRVEGRVMTTTYSNYGNGGLVSNLEIKRTVEEQAKSGGGQIVYEGDGDNNYDMTIKFERNGVPVWVEINGQCQSSGGGTGCYTVWVVEERKLHS
jgi:hypothetical protein